MSIKYGNYTEFSDHLFTFFRNSRRPYRIMFELTNRCNFRCPHCYNKLKERIGKEKQELNTASVFKIIDRLRDLGCFIIGLTGGEIFLRDDICDIISYCKSKAMIVILFTNGFFINEDMADKISDLSVNKIDISLHALDEKVFESITGVRGSYRKVMRAIELLHKRNVQFSFKTCPMAHNEHELIKISAYAKALGVRHRIGSDILFNSRHGCNSALAIDKLIAADMSVYSAERKKVINQNNVVCSTKKRNSFRQVFRCGAGYTESCVNYLGELKLCLHIDEPSYGLLEMPPEQCWKEVKGFVDGLNKEDFACWDCGLYDYCDWCPAKSWIENGGLLACSRREREKAMLRKDSVLSHGLYER